MCVTQRETDDLTWPLTAKETITASFCSRERCIVLREHQVTGINSGLHCWKRAKVVGETAELREAFIILEGNLKNPLITRIARVSPQYLFDYVLLRSEYTVMFRMVKLSNQSAMKGQSDMVENLRGSIWQPAQSRCADGEMNFDPQHTVSSHKE